MAATTENIDALNQIFNVAVGDRTSLNELYKMLKILTSNQFNERHSKLIYRDFREGDVRHSQADISKAKNLLGYKPTHNVKKGLKETVEWHISQRQ